MPGVVDEEPRLTICWRNRTATTDLTHAHNFFGDGGCVGPCPCAPQAVAPLVCGPLHELVCRGRKDVCATVPHGMFYRLAQGAAHGPCTDFELPDGSCPPGNTFCVGEPPRTVCGSPLTHHATKPGACRACMYDGSCGGPDPDERGVVYRSVRVAEAECAAENAALAAACAAPPTPGPVVGALIMSVAAMFVSVAMMACVLYSCPRSGGGRAVSAANALRRL
jgi:hypothetical protein